MKTKWGRLLLSIGICLGVGVAGSIFTGQSVKSWYPTLIKPSFNPPAWVFGPVWTILFILMGIALYLVWRKGIHKKKVCDGVALFVVQLVLNFLWSYFFFGLHNPLLAMVDIIVLIAAVVLTMYKFWGIDRKAGWLLVPYLLWISFALVLNLSIVMLN